MRSANAKGKAPPGKAERWRKAEAVVRSMHSNHTYREMAVVAGVSPQTISRVCKAMGLVRSRATATALMRRTRNAIIRKERMRIRWGLEQVTAMKLVCNHRRIWLKSKLRRCGYLTERGSPVVRVPPGLRRHPVLEAHAVALGLIIETAREN